VAVASTTGLVVVSAGGARDVTLGSRPVAIVWAPHLGRFVVAAERTLWTVDTSGNARRIARLPGLARSLALAPGPDRVVAVSTDGPREGVTLYRIGRDRTVRIGGGVEPRRLPGRVSVGDVDGDGRFEVLVLVTGRARFDRRERVRPFVYGWDGRRLYPKWLGSRLSRPFDDAVFGDVAGDAASEIVAVELTSDGRRELAVYRWTGFGVERIATSPPADSVCALAVDGERRILALANQSACSYRITGERIEASETGPGAHDAVAIVDGAVVAVQGRTFTPVPGESNR
jgi:hypothetical protein